MIDKILLAIAALPSVFKSLGAAWEKILFYYNLLKEKLAEYYRNRRADKIEEALREAYEKKDPSKLNELFNSSKNQPKP